MVVDAPPAVDARAPHDVCVTAEEAAFIQAAFERILPEAPGVPAWTYVDRKLAEQRRGDGPARELILYRQGIARVEARCRLDHRRDFQALDVWHQLAILAELEDPEREDPDSLRPFVLMLVNDLAEAYFDALHHRTTRGHAGMAAHEASGGEPCPEPLPS